MLAPLLATKLYVPPPRPGLVSRPHLVARLNEGLAAGHKLTLISASAGFGKTTLLSEWISLNAENRMQNDELTHAIHRSALKNSHFLAAWLSLDESDSEPLRFLGYMIAALQTIEPELGQPALAALQASQPPPVTGLLTGLLNEITALPGKFILVLDDYHSLDSEPIDQALNYLLDHLPPQLHLVIASREDPDLPLARLRARGQLTELRATDLRFTPAEAAEFLNRVMGLNLSEAEVAALEARTEGWISGLQLAALSMQGHQDAASFIKSFTGSHHFVLNYLIEEVLQQQSESVHTFLLRTSILDRMCGPLCDAVLLASPASGQETLENLERANLFIVPLDNERRWYRYHHLFRDLLRQRLGQSLIPEAIAQDHVRASEWYENNRLVFDAFRHAAAANDVERAERLMESKEMPLHFSSVARDVLNWLASLPTTALDTRPLLWVRSATLALMAGQTTGVEEKLQAAERALQTDDPDDKTRDLIGQIAAARATLALTQYQADAIIVQSHRALEYLHPDNLSFRFTAVWTLAFAYHLMGDRAAAIRSYTEGIAISEKSGEIFSTILATTGLGQVQELENQLYLAAETYRSVLPLFGDHPEPNAAEAHLGLAHIYYEWNDLESAEQYGQQSLQLARQYDHVVDRFIISEVFLSRLKLARGDVDGAAALLAQAEQSARRQNFLLRMPEIAAAQVLVLLRQGSLDAAADLAQAHELPLSRARVLLTQGDTSTALAVLEPLRQQMEAKGWVDEQLRVMVLQAVALHTHGEKDKAVQLLGDALALAKPGGFIRTFVDEGLPMAQLLSEAVTHRVMPDYVGKLLAVFEDETKDERRTTEPSPSSSVEPLSQRELEVLQLIAQGLSNQEICKRLFLALDTVKGHNRRIFNKLQVQRRTEAIARARELGLI